MSKNEQVKLKVYLFKAAPEDEPPVNDTILLSSVNTNCYSSSTSNKSLFLQQPQQQGANQQETKNDTTNLLDHGQDKLTLTLTTVVAAPPLLQPSDHQDQQQTTRGSPPPQMITEEEGGGAGGTTIDKSKSNLNPISISKDPFITLLNSSQIENQLVPVLVFQYSNLDTLWRHHLKHPAKHAGIVLTSPRCVHSITEAIKAHDESGEWEKGLRSEWESKYVFCVGPSTVSTAMKLLPSLKTHLLITGLESHAESLASNIIDVSATEAFNASLLYPCGVQRRDVLLSKLKDASIQCSQCIVYQSVKNPALETIIQFITEELKNFHHTDQKKTVICFFSPSGVKHVFQHLDSNVIDHHRANVCQIVAIGPTTKTALEEHLAQNGVIKQIYQCKNPTPEDLLDVIKSIESQCYQSFSTNKVS